MTDLPDVQPGDVLTPGVVDVIAKVAALFDEEPATRVGALASSHELLRSQLAQITAERDALKATLTRGPARLQELERVHAAAVALVDAWEKDPPSSPETAPLDAYFDLADLVAPEAER